MAVVRIGYQRLYDAVGCSLQECQEFSSEFVYEENLNVRAYLGPHPQYGIWVCTADKQMVPGEVPRICIEFQGDAAKSSYRRKFFAEVSVWKETVIDDSLWKEFEVRQEKAIQTVVDLAYRSIKDFKPITELVAGTIGLRFHRQLTSYLICESYFAIFNDGTFVSNGCSPALEVLENVGITQHGIDGLRGLPEIIDRVRKDSKRRSSVVLSWLMRAWAEQEPISKFLTLFIPLEMVLQGYNGSDQPETNRKTELIRQLIISHGSDNKNELLPYFDHLAKLQKPGLPARFSQVAQQARMSGWEQDIEAFTRFNQLRNALLHRGDPDIKLVVDVSEEQVRQLQDITERYVSWSQFGDGVVYQSDKRLTKWPETLADRKT